MAKKKWFNPRDFADFIERFNPFGFKQPNGEVCIFEDYGKLYEYTLKKLYESFPRGYLDLSLFLHEQTGMPIGDCEDVVRGWKREGISSDVHLLEEGWEPNVERDRYLVNLFKALHTISETKFDAAKFSQELVVFDRIRKERKEYERSSFNGE